MMDGSSRKLYLASASPRRAKLLLDAGVRFEVIVPPMDDAAFDLENTSAAHAVEALAYAKAACVAELAGAGALVLGADTMLSVDGRRLGKPRDVDDARAMLGGLFGRTHQVITAVALLDTTMHDRTMLHDATDVTISPPEGKTLEAYLASGQWAGKAGGYNLAELQDAWRFDVQGDPTTVIGLPMRKLAELLRPFHRADGISPA